MYMIVLAELSEFYIQKKMFSPKTVQFLSNRYTENVCRPQNIFPRLVIFQLILLLHAQMFQSVIINHNEFYSVSH